MMRVKDHNGCRLLTIITNELLKYSGHGVSQQSGEIIGKLWDEIGT